MGSSTSSQVRTWAPNVEPLPEDLVNELFQYLDKVSDVVRSCHVCKLWRDCGYRTSTWMKLYQITFKPQLDEFSQDVPSISSENRSIWRAKFVNAYEGKRRIFTSTAPKISWKVGDSTKNLLTKTRLFINDNYIFCIGYSIGSYERLEILRWKRDNPSDHEAKFWDGTTYIFGCSPTYFLSSDRRIIFIVQNQPTKQIETFDLLQWSTVSTVPFETDGKDDGDRVWFNLVQDGLAQICSCGSGVSSSIIDGNLALKQYEPVWRSDKLPTGTDVISISGEVGLLRTVGAYEKIHLQNMVTGEKLGEIELKEHCLPTLAKFISQHDYIIAGEFGLLLLEFGLNRATHLVSVPRPVKRSPRWNFTVKHNTLFALADWKSDDSSIERHLYVVDLGDLSRKPVRVITRDRWDGVFVDDMMNVYMLQDHTLSKLVF